MLALALSLWFSSNTVFAASGTVCSNAGKDPITNDGVNNYLIAKLEGAGQAIPFAYAMNKCTTHNVLEGGPYYRHWCQTDTEAMTQAFSDANCTKSISDPIPVAKGSVGGVGYFECGGEDTYVKLLVGSDQKNSGVCPKLETIYAGLGACVNTFESMQLTYSLRFIAIPQVPSLSGSQILQVSVERRDTKSLQQRKGSC
ncbi:hypothetical protein RFI_21762 [Reticulomyxa filosa]|uniref:Uncharacterized protein n=1 Tax=Reticulomyxa filosa TaxID=46433 RepID=X6MQ90_RETFI|nr:hypothetical protein RFI_21762 [Reticulomyxa filosa]|eukprot:ETO15602.1 hypothetical protein RFI_21762 [Reticulomyxa filosa]